MNIYVDIHGKFRYVTGQIFFQTETILRGLFSKRDLAYVSSQLIRNTPYLP